MLTRIETDFLVVVSDLHCGSTLGLCPEVVDLDDGENSYSTGVPQKALLALWGVFWSHFVPHVTGGQPFTLVVNGDAVEGDHHGTSQLITRNLGYHVRIAETLLHPVVERAARTEIVRGTEAHVGSSGQYEEELAAILGTQRRGGTYSRWQLWCEFGPYLVHLAHHIGTTSSSAYEHSSLSREVVANLVESAQWDERPADLIIRSHRHRCCYAGIPTARGVCEIHVTPGWQMRTAFGHKLSSMRQPQVGGLVVGRDGWGLWVRRFVWVPPRNGKVGLTPEAAMRLSFAGKPCSRPSTKARAGGRARRA